MKYIRFWAETEFCGTDEESFEDFEDNVTEEELDEYAEDRGIQNAESFEYLATGWDEDFENDDERDNYYASCSWGWEEISKEEFEEHVRAD